MRPINLKRGARVARLAIALLSVVNATAALAVPKVSAHGCGRALMAVEAAAPRGLQLRVQRPPRVPRREPFVAGPTVAMASGADE